MNPPEKTSGAFVRALLLLSFICIALIFLINGTLIHGIAQSEEREIEDKIPKHLPIKVKIRKETEQAFKDLGNDKWIGDVEFEVTNTSDKPIYYLTFDVVLLDVTAPNGTNIAFPFHYGRTELGSIQSKAGPDDVPIKPGQTIILKAHKGNVRGWDAFRRDYGWSQPKRISFRFVVLTFGDGTGFEGPDGESLPEPSKRTSDLWPRAPYAGRSNLYYPTAPPEERVLENTVPKHLPIKVMIPKEKEKAFKDWDNEKWMHEFELEVTNTGTKPIYFLHLSIEFPEIVIPYGTDKMGWTLGFGRRERFYIETKAEPDDPSIKPGETIVLRFYDMEISEWERFRKRENYPDPKKLILYFQLLSFGDGTGFIGTTGATVPHPPRAGR